VVGRLPLAGQPRKRRRPSSGKPGANQEGGGYGPYSRVLRKFALGGVNGSSREGRFLRDLEAQLVAHIGGKPSAAERLLIGRLARVALRLELFDIKIESGKDMTVFDAKIYGALHNSFRLMLRELGLKSAPSTSPDPLSKNGRSVADLVAQR
jgi:hypothetical protein